MKAVTNLMIKEHMDFDVATVTDMANHEDVKTLRVKPLKDARLNTEQLFTNVKEVLIEHLNETYILRITKQNKLILTK